ncbi:CLUMA_CG019254, isoform A [Clunio marinus]|uniref:CLUMA_CG019254, isoform A n=1 Tax=Clunio marinus TaxID=568069 RepID=A0A1J1J0H1_9DIPT|nr:CLUMA_CG019254, isoform A [Clunio marinus]
MFANIFLEQTQNWQLTGFVFYSHRCVLKTYNMEQVVEYHFGNGIANERIKLLLTSKAKITKTMNSRIL